MTQITHRVEDWVPPFVNLAAAKLKMGKGEIVTAALRAYRDSLVRSGVLTEEEGR